MEKQFILFHANYCGKCHTLKKRIQRLKDKDQIDMDVQMVDIETNKTLVKKYHVEGVPTLIVLENGHETKRLQGSIYKEELIELMK